MAPNPSARHSMWVQQLEFWRLAMRLTVCLPGHLLTLDRFVVVSLDKDADIFVCFVPVAIQILQPI